MSITSNLRRMTKIVDLLESAHLDSRDKISDEEVQKLARIVFVLRTIIESIHHDAIILTAAERNSIPSLSYN